MTVLLAVLSVVAMSAHAGPILKPQPLPDEAYGEAYTAVASLEDGSFVLLQLMFSNAGVGSRKAACRALWVPPGKAGINASQKIDSDNWSYNSANDTLTAGTCSLGTNGSSIKFSARLPDLSVALNIATSLRTVKPPNHRVNVKQAFYQAELLVPAARATASIKAGGQIVNTRGMAHLDHSLSNVLMPNAASCWMRFRGFFGESPTLAQVRVAPDGGPADGWIWPLNDSAPTPLSNAQIKIGRTDKGRPTLSVTGSSTLEVAPSRQLYRYRPAEAYGALGRLASPWIGDPTTTTYRARGTTSKGSVSGILEVLEIDDPGCAVQ